MKSIKILLAGATLLAGAGVAVAQQPGARGPMADVTRDQAVARAEQRFQQLDANRDGRVTADEARQVRQAGRAERQGRLFDRLDANRDGSLSREEFAARGQMRGERGAGRGMGGMRGGAEGRAMRMFGEDGVITAEEFRARALQRFERLDANRDGTVTMAERQQVRQQMRQQRMERRQQRN